MKDNNYLEVNQKAWNRKVKDHVNSDFYDVPSFLKGKTSLNTIELDLLGDLSGQSVLHLQCHFGQDTLSLSRMGAEATGVDFSDKAIKQAKELANRLNLDTRFICCDVYSLPDHLDEQFDLVFTSYGTIGWLPDLDQWASVVSRFLKPGGRFVFVEFHPVVWMFDDDLQKITYSYFNTDVIQDEEVGTYADRDSEEQHQFICWNHPLDEVFNSLNNAGLTWESFREYDYSPYGFLSCCEQVGEREYIIKHLGRKLPLVYSLTCSKS